MSVIESGHSREDTIQAGAGLGAVVIGAGPAGLAAAATFEGKGIGAVVLERAASVGASWRARYDGLRLNTSRYLSRLPGLPFPRSAHRFPSRDEVVSYLESYVEHHRLDVRLGCEAGRVERVPGGWRIACGDGAFEAARVVVATGWDRVPHVPRWPGRDGFTGELIHAAEYRNPAPYRGREVLVVGPGCSGSEIAFQTAAGGASRVRLAVRTPPHMVLRSFGVPADVLGVVGEALPPRISDPQARVLRRLAIGDLSAHGLPAPRDGLYGRFEGRRLAPTTVDRDVVDAIRSGLIEIVPAVARLSGGRVEFADGSAIEPDVVIAATGYRRGLERLVGHLGVLDDDGAPLVAGPDEHPRAPGLTFIGFDPHIPGTFRQIRIETRRLRRRL